VGVLIISVVLALAGYRRRDKRLFFTGLSAFGLLICMAGTVMILLFGLDETYDNVQQALVSGAVMGFGIAVLCIGILGMLRPTMIWPDKPHA